MDEVSTPTTRRGTVLLIISLIVVGTTFTFIVLPETFPINETSVRVAVLDSGVDVTASLGPRILASHSFISTKLGYPENITSTKDSNPKEINHGTIISQIIIENAPNTGIINAKVVDGSDHVTIDALIEAIHWAVENQSCHIINLSLGGTTPDQERLHEIIQWAWQKGVSIVAAAGNSGINGIRGTSIEAPALFQEVIAVGAVDENGFPYPFSGRGPLADRTIKPDLSAIGYYSSNTETYYGTSFATPHVTAGAARIIRACQENDWLWTPGMIKAILLSTTSYLGAESWEVGTGLLDVGTAISYLESSTKKDNLPMIVWVQPFLGKYSFERWFVNTTITIKVSIFSSSYGSFRVFMDGSASLWIDDVDDFVMNQSHSLSLTLRVISSQDMFGQQARIIFDSSEYQRVWTQMKFDSKVPFAKVAFDFTHTSWSIDSIYGQFRSLYMKLTQLGLSVEQIADRDSITLSKLQEFDALLVLDPCAWEYENNGGFAVPIASIRYTKEELLIYQQYWESGGSILIAAGDNSSMDINGITPLTNRFGVVLEHERVPGFSFSINGIPSTEEVHDINSTHPVMMRLDSFDYNGCTLNFTNGGSTLAWGWVRMEDNEGKIVTILRPIMYANQNDAGGRVIVSGSNYFLDNYALNGYYHSEENSKLVLQVVYWLLGLL